MCTTCNVFKPFKDISELKYFGDLNLKKKIRKEIIGKLCGVGHDTVNKYARKIYTFPQKMKYLLLPEKHRKGKIMSWI